MSIIFPVDGHRPLARKAQSDESGWTRVGRVLEDSLESYAGNENKHSHASC